MAPCLQAIDHCAATDVVKGTAIGLDAFQRSDLLGSITGSCSELSTVVTYPCSLITECSRDVRREASAQD